MEPVTCPHCQQPVIKVVTVATKVDLWRWDGKGYICLGETDLEEPWARSGFEPQYCSMLYLCSICHLSISQEAVDERVYFPWLEKVEDEPD